VIKSRRRRCAGHSAALGRREVNTGIWGENLKERDHLEEPGVDERIILRWISMKLGVGAWTGLM